MPRSEVHARESESRALDSEAEVKAVAGSFSNSLNPAGPKDYELLLFFADVRSHEMEYEPVLRTAFHG